MTKEQCSLQPNYYGSSCDFQDLQSAVQQLTTKSDAQFEELKNEKWFHRIFNMVICPRKNNIRMAEQITSLAQAQGILIEILVRLADQDANIAGMVMQSQSDIRALAQNSAYLQERLYLLEDKSYGIRLHDLMDFNRAFQQYDTLDGANCLTVGKRHLSQKEAAMEAVRKIGLNQFVDVAVDIFPEYENWLIKFQVRLHALKANESFR